MSLASTDLILPTLQHQLKQSDVDVDGNDLSTILVFHKGSSKSISVSSSTTLGQLCKNHLPSQFNLSTLRSLKPLQSSSSLPFLLPEEDLKQEKQTFLFKLIINKPPRTILSPGPCDELSIDELGLLEQDKIILLTSVQEDVKRADQAIDLFKKRDAIRQNALRNPTKIWTRPQSQTSSENYSFGKLQLLPNLPLESRRLDLLNQLANHPSVKVQMKKHHLSVGVLGELDPWMDSEILGVNHSAGQVIRLRLLTDDRKSVRPLSMVRRVLSHELAHNRFSSHELS
ncbi:WLM domain-containing protein [Phakopsora pachyrhizi]|nr:WLM domain-containing protein [Phakopsora pachyrhizi]